MDDKKLNKDLFDDDISYGSETLKEKVNLSNRDEEELDNAIEILLSEKKVWENAFNLAKIEIKEKDLEIEDLKRRLNEKENNNTEDIEDFYNEERHLLKGPFGTNFDSNKAIINGRDKKRKSFEDFALEELIRIAKEETELLEDNKVFISRLERCKELDTAYKIIFRSLIELKLENQSQDQRIESLNEELYATQEAVQNLQNTIQDSQNSSKLISIAYTSQIKSLQDDLLNACKDIDFWKEQCEYYNNKMDLDKEMNKESVSEDINLNEWCNLGSGINTMIEVEIMPNSYWWFIAF